ncbi:hypothetical protein K377_06184, partial [Streptomyces sp. PsTaAH-137]
MVCTASNDLKFQTRTVWSLLLVTARGVPSRLVHATAVT